MNFRSFSSPSVPSAVRIEGQQTLSKPRRPGDEVGERPISGLPLGICPRFSRRIFLLLKLIQIFIIFVILFAKPLLFSLLRIIFVCSVTHVSRRIVFSVGAVTFFGT